MIYLKKTISLILLILPIYLSANVTIIDFTHHDPAGISTDDYIHVKVEVVGNNAERQVSLGVLIPALFSSPFRYYYLWNMRRNLIKARNISVPDRIRE